ncbi:inorganic triphosphatase [Caviibacterium pharyngocola]|uniref:Inorganic triphosphatase n=1 Tax=Caviibacterium pharyngocola TaxID=28159 RepID=A0A2M8RWP6_9PAST|nr:inorganic triphosphatase [Caviibacterium pharyngocola]PJG83315.1 inorganic triphosphatase [Caviibacterium pharyngocola]
MSNEVELKLAVSPDFAEFLSQALSGLNVISQQTIFLGNSYYDSTDGFFAAHKMGLRIRRENDDFTLTLKTDGKVAGGLHIRPEYNVPLAENKADLTELVTRYDLDKSWLQLSLQAIFSTDFQRRLWLVEQGGTVIEVALDQGEIVAGEKREPICEVEFELKQGKITDLLRFVASLTLENGVRLSSASKAQRGYRLVAGKMPSAQDWLERWKDFLQSSQNMPKPLQKLTALFQFEQDLIEETVNLGADFFAQNFLRTVERVGAFFNLYHFYSENGKLLESAVNEQIESGRLHREDDLMLRLLDSHSRLLAAMKEIIRFHSETKDNAKAMAKLLELLHSAQYVHRMLDLILLTLNEND